MLDDCVVRGVGLAVEFDDEAFAYWVGPQVDRGGHQAANEASRVVVPLEMFPHFGHQRT